MKFRKGARQEFRQLKKQKKHAQSVRYLQWQQNGHGGGGKIQKSKGAVNMRGINGQMNRIFTQLDIYERPQPEKPKAPDNEEEEIHSDDSEVDLGDRLVSVPQLGAPYEVQMRKVPPEFRLEIRVRVII